MRAARLGVASLAVAWLAGGCSFVGMNTERSVLVCTRKPTLPILDTVGFGLAAGTAALANIPISSDVMDGRREFIFTDSARGEITVGALVGAAVLGASAAYGFTSANRCRHLAD